MSMPMICELLSAAKNSLGAYEASVATMTLPAEVSFDGTMAARLASLVAVGIGVLGTVVVGAAVVPVVDVDFELLQAARTTIRPARATPPTIRRRSRPLACLRRLDVWSLMWSPPRSPTIRSIANRTLLHRIRWIWFLP